MCLFPDKIINKIPSIVKIFLRDSEKNNLSYKDYIPSISKDPITIWKLSQLEYSLKEIEKTYANNLEKKVEFTEKIMKEAKNLVKTGKMNSEILHKLPEFFEEMEKNSVLSRIKGFFTFVNLIWMIAILGIVISIGPSLFFLLRPFVILPGILLHKFILPFIIFLYKYGFFEFLGYYISIIFIADGMKVSKEWGFFISLTGAGFIFALYFYSILKYGKYAINDNEYIILGTLITLTLFSLSITFNSQIFSFLATIVFYYFLGFYTGCFGLCYVIGFLNVNDMYRVV
jgi:hypothetical protein